MVSPEMRPENKSTAIRVIVSPLKLKGEFFPGRKPETKQLGRDVLSVIPLLADPAFDIQRREEIADFFSVSVGRVTYVTRVLQNEGFLYVSQGKLLAYFRSEQNRVVNNEETKNS